MQNILDISDLKEAYIEGNEEDKNLEDTINFQDINLRKEEAQKIRITSKSHLHEKSEEHGSHLSVDEEMSSNPEPEVCLDHHNMTEEMEDSYVKAQGDIGEIRA
jgi:hypothetical protein